MRHVFNVPEVPQRWAEQLEGGIDPKAWGRSKSSSLRFEGPSLFSYGAEIARIVKGEDGRLWAAVSPDSWSCTTSHHQTLANGAAGHRSLWMMFFDDPVRSRDSQYLSVLEGIRRSIRGRRRRATSTWALRRMRKIEEAFGLESREVPQPNVVNHPELESTGSRGAYTSVTFECRTYYFIDNMRVPKWLFFGKITPSRVLSTSNAEVRRLGTEMYGGWDAFVRIIPGARMVHKDDFGELWDIPASGEREGKITVVKVVNSTPEPDGTFKDYFLRVHPDLRPMYGDRWLPLGEPQERTARNAVASTFGLTGQDYCVVEES